LGKNGSEPFTNFRADSFGMDAADLNSFACGISHEISTGEIAPET
jgi:hypothetical protein